MAELSPWPSLARLAAGSLEVPARKLPVKGLHTSRLPCRGLFPCCNIHVSYQASLSIDEDHAWRCAVHDPNPLGLACSQTSKRIQSQIQWTKQLLINEWAKLKSCSVPWEASASSRRCSGTHICDHIALLHDILSCPTSCVDSTVKCPAVDIILLCLASKKSSIKHHKIVTSEKLACCVPKAW